jgi:SAM-dependent methyltransferase
VWFDDSDAEAKIVAFLSAWRRRRQQAGIVGEDDGHDDSDSDDDDETEDATTTFLDLGCGNGSLLLALRAARWRGQMLGVDYSEQSIALARNVAAAAAEEEEPSQDEEKDTPITPPLRFHHWDAIAGPLAPVLSDAGRPAGWDVVLDKGTFDAISLSAERDAASGRRVSELYRDRVLRLVRPGGIFLITSCNWTEAELEAWFAGGHDEAGRQDAQDARGSFVVDGKVEYRSFSFGGVKGQTISSVCFKKTA